MRLRALRIVALRCIREARLEISGDLVVLEGRNGAGKTSVLEAIHLLGHGRSFRAGAIEGLIMRGTERFAVAATAETAQGVRRGGWVWGGAVGQARLEGKVCRKAELLAAFRVITQHPESHGLIQGPREQRRRFIDWLLFHVEPEFLAVWNDFRRALRQRNVAIRRGAEDRVLAAWEPPIARAGEWIAARRRHWLERLAVRLAEDARVLSGELVEAKLIPIDGWPAQLGLEEVLSRRRTQDRERGRTEAGPHRGGFELRWNGLEGERLSRGEAKLAALALILAAAELLGGEGREKPVLLLDDFASELDEEHQEAVIERLSGFAGQVWMTLTEEPRSLRLWPGSVTRFHVERGTIRPA